MPFKYIWEDRGFYSKFWGTILDRDIEIKNMYFSGMYFSGDPRSDNCRYQILDASEVEEFVLSDFEINKMASNDIGIGFYVKKFSVVLVSSKPIIRDAFQRYIQTCIRSNVTWKFHICDTLEQAREWLRQLDEQEPGSHITSTQDNRARQSPTTVTRKGSDSTC